MLNQGDQDVFGVKSKCLAIASDHAQTDILLPYQPWSFLVNSVYCRHFAHENNLTN